MILDGVSGASFRDPSGFVAKENGQFIRIVQPSYSENYQQLFSSGLYRALTEKGLLIPHEEIESHSFQGAFKVLKPRQLSFISYPYEWSFSQLKDAAVTTLEIQRMALECGMTLKDASAFNIQFVDGKPMLIDTLSFEKLKLQPWIAYAQFCRHFLAPLALMSYRDARLNQMLRAHLDGLPLALASKLLPLRSRMNFWLLVHLHLHAASEKRFDRKPVQRAEQPSYRLSSLHGTVQSLESAVNKLNWVPPKNVWADYYESTVTGGKYVEHKKQIVAEYLGIARPKTVWDLGANTGLFSRLAAASGADTFSFDGDPDCVEINYLEGRKKNESRLLPLVMELTNPSPALGWEHRERMSWVERANPEMVFALAVIHHLAIGNNLPLCKVRDFFSRLSTWLVIEFVPKDDSNAQKLLQVREDIFGDYTRENFEKQFNQCFEILKSTQVQDSNRVLYLMRRKES
ncbi:MAG: SAM-dependent methyltransferase [Verrucomicrobiota bacterium]